MSKPKEESHKPAKSKRGLVSSSVKPSRIALFLLGTLMIVSGIYYVLSSHAGTTGRIIVSATIDGAPVSNYEVQIKNEGSTGACDSNIIAYGYLGNPSEWYGITSPFNNFIQISNCNTGSGGQKYFQMTNSNAAGQPNLQFLGMGASVPGSNTLVDQPPPYRFLVRDGFDTRIQVRMHYVAPPPPPPPPTLYFATSAATVLFNGTVQLGWTGTDVSNCRISEGFYAPGAVSNPPGTWNSPALNVSGLSTYGLHCQSSSGEISRGVNVTVLPPAPVVSLSANQSIANNTSTTINWSSTNANYCVFSAGTGYSGAERPTSGSWTTPNLTDSTTYRVSCNGNGGGGYKDIGISVAGKPAPPPPPPPRGGDGGGGNSGGGTTQHTTTTNSKPTVAATASNPSDTEVPSTPGNLKSSQNDSASVDLTWDASTDNSSVAGYVVERSTDGTTWTKLSESVTDTTYNDTTISFGTKYSYRVSAFDGAGNVSVPATVDVETETFTANAFADKDNKISSDDGQVTVSIPSGALGEDAACTVSGREDITASFPKGSSVEAGPYQLVCKKKDGNTIDNYNKAVTFEVSLSNPKGNLTHKIYDFDGDKWVATKIKYNGKQPNFTWTTDKPNAFAVVKSSGSNWGLWISIIFIILLLGGILFWFLRRRANSSGGSDAGYDSYVQSHYIDQPAAPGTDTTPHHEVGERAGIADFQPVAPPPVPGQVVSADELRAPGDTGGVAPNPANSPDVNKIVNHPQDPKPPTG